MHTKGFHLLLDVWLAEPINDSLADKIKNYVRTHFTVVSEVEKKFEPWGLTSVLVLSESHFTIHTYPEHNYISMDLYICNPDINLKKTRNEILELLKVKHFESSFQVRGVKARSSEYGIHEMDGPTGESTL